jgi:hypothetical protein
MRPPAHQAGSKIGFQYVPMDPEKWSLVSTKPFVMRDLVRLVQTISSLVVYSPALKSLIPPQFVWKSSTVPQSTPLIRTSFSPRFDSTKWAHIPPFWDSNKHGGYTLNILKAETTSSHQIFLGQYWFKGNFIGNPHACWLQTRVSD